MDRSDHQNGGVGVGGGLAALVEIRCPASGRALDLRRAWPRRPGHLLLEYGDGDTTVAGQWFADRRRLRAVAGQTAAVAPDKVSYDDHLGVLVQRRGADRRLPVLAEALDHDGAALVVHRPERRAVVRRRRAGATTYLKLVRPDRALPGTTEVRGLRVPTVVRTEPVRGLVEHTELAGRTLHDLLGDSSSGVAGTDIVSRAFQGAGRAVRALHTTAPPSGLAAHRPQDEVAVAARWVDHAVVHGVLVGGAPTRATEALAQLGADLSQLPPPPAPVLVHRDLHDKQVLVVGDDDAGLLDLDTLAAGDPALDVANLLVHLELRALQGHCRTDVAQAAGDAFVDGYRPDRALRARLGAYAGATRLRLACVYAFRPRWADVAARLLLPV